MPNWSLSHPAAFDLKVIHPLNTDLILEASLASGNSAECGEVGKHAKNDEMCSELGWTCLPLVVEVYGGWGCEAEECFSRLSKRLAMQMGLSDNEALSQIYCLLGVPLMRQNARTILLRCPHFPFMNVNYIYCVLLLLYIIIGGWGCEAQECYSRLSKRLAMQVGICETEALSQMYCLLAVTLMWQNARAILLRCARAPLLEY